MRRRPCDLDAGRQAAGELPIQDNSARPRSGQKRQRDEYDPPWKEMIGDYFTEFVAFFFPEAFADIDWRRSYEALDKELHKIMRDAAVGRRIADKLVKVWLTNGEEQFVLIHVEVQGRKEDDFGERMFVYNYRVFDVYRRRSKQAPVVVSFALLADDTEHWRPAGYHYGRWSSRMGLEFAAVKLRDYNDRWAELEADPNPFATVVMAYLKARETREDPQRRFRWKSQLIRALYERGFERQEVLDLFRFIDWVMRLPDDLEDRFWDEHEQYETERKMRYITSVERIGIRKGIKQGETRLFKIQLLHRFADLPAWVEQRLAEASQEDVERWSLRLLDAQSLEDVFATA